MTKAKKQTIKRSPLAKYHRTHKETKPRQQQILHGNSVCSTSKLEVRHGLAEELWWSLATETSGDTSAKFSCPT
eukprot:m.90521 g.90521  ORF g.90521 m.90521 type:complete len:74 (+) comp14602_c0_seq23:1886-2107(+)